MDHGRKHVNPSPYLGANPVSKLLYWWMKDLFLVGLRDDLRQDDLYNPLPRDLSDKLGDKMESIWSEKKLSSGHRSGFLVKTIVKMFGWEYMKCGILLLIVSCVIRVSQPLLLASLIHHFTPGAATSRTTALVHAGCLLATAFCSTLLYNHANRLSMDLGMRVRVACCSLVYRKVLRLSQRATGMTTTGQVVNLMSNDVNRFDRLPLLLHYLWILPVQTVVITHLMWRSVGAAALVGVGTLFAQTVPVQGYVSRIISKLRMKIATRTDERVKLMNEIISGIQVIKMYAWEKPFEKMVSYVRRREISMVRKAAYLRSMFFAAIVFSERITLFVTLVSYVLMGNRITPDVVFSLAQFFSILEMTMAILYPQAVQLSAEARVSIKRIEAFLALEEIADGPEEEEKEKEKEKEKEEVKRKVGVKMVNACAKWTPDPIVDTLHGLTAELEPGRFCAVIGPVGSGKSSLLQAMLGELPLSSGSLEVGGEMSYASQEPWLFVGSVRSNILFGQPYEPRRYQEVVRVCALQRDLELFPHGDKTIVGERGVSLSGGQRARINLARCVYREADVYLLDDPLSAVDSHVSKHLLEECIRGRLAAKTRVLATHQLQHVRDADLVVVLNNGRIEDQGTYNELLARKVNFSSLLTKQEAEKVAPTESVAALLRRKVSVDSIQSNYEEEEDSEDEGSTDEGELLSKGRMKASVIREYFKAGGSSLALFGLALSLLSGQAASSGADYWVTFWTNQEQLRQSLTTRDNQTAREGLGPGETGVVFSQEVAMCIYGALIAGTVVFTLFRTVFFFKVCMSASINLHDSMFGCMLRGAMRFFDTNPSGRVLNRFSKDMGTIDELIPAFIFEAVQIFLTMAGILAMVAYVNYLLIIPMACVAPLYYLLSRVYLATAQGIKRLEGATRSPVFSHVSASFNGLATIRCSRAQQMLKKEFDSHQDLHTSAWHLTIATMMAYGMWLDFVSNMFVGAVMFSFLMFESEYFGANVGLAISQAMMLTGMLQYGIRQVTEVLNQMTAVERVIEYAKIEKETGIDSGRKPPATWPFKGAIEFDHVNLSYSVSDPPVLHDLCFKINGAEKVGIVGRTGAGKSSLISALFRLAKIEGSIKIDNLNTDTIDLYNLRSRISIIPQEPVLFSSSLRNNLDPFHNYEDSALWSALEEVELKAGVESLDLYVNSGGSNFSAGQRQLICLARAIVRDNQVLVMDEATANVDPQTDAMIQKTIRRKFRSCTVLTIAHRLNTIIDSDRVLVMDAGTVVEFDHPYILLQNTEGHFHKMVRETGESMFEYLSKAAEQAYRSQRVNDDGLDFATSENSASQITAKENSLRPS
ncbi:ATP-binding cassette sub-family C member 4-like [Bacillus rossius redtenbacheri]|uniref:ATP-binding cassette sub-family C member 4-like n=1 Tax=Bacillus rossius redtenbacheri TaxID=93214 RepID=UPI002FDE27B9